METSSRRCLIDEICAAEGITATWFSDDWFVMFERNGEQHYAYGYTFELNPAASDALARDKCAAYDILAQHGISAVEHHILYEDTNQASYADGHRGLADLRQFFDQHNHHIVIKPNNGSAGHCVYQLTKLDQAEELLQEIFRHGFAAAMCPFYNILCEYRVVLLDDEPRLIYQKNRQGDWRFNLSAGSLATPVTDPQLTQELIALARSAAKALNLRFASIDILKTTQPGLRLMEVNSGVMINHYVKQHPEERNKVKAIYRDAILKMFSRPC